MPRLRSLVGAALALALVITSHSQAHADAHEESPAVAEASAQLTLPAGALLVQLPVEVSLTKDQVAKPLSIAPDLWYGVADKLSVGIIHSTVGAAGVYGTAGQGVCVTGDGDGGCEKVYDNAGLAVRYGVLDGGFSLAADVGAFASSFDPFTLSAKVGFTGMLPAGPLHVIFSPNIFIGITERDAGDGGGAGNKEVISVPVTFALGLGSKLSLGVQAGLLAPLDGFSDGIVVPLAGGLRFSLTPKLGFDATFSFPLFYNKAIDDGTNTDVRTVVFTTNVAL